MADIPKLKKLIAEFGKTGSNLNQIAKHFNQGGIQTQEILNSIRPCMSQIYEMKYAVLKIAGDFSTARKQTESSKGKPHGDTETHSS